jgi:protein TonB
VGTLQNNLLNLHVFSNENPEIILLAANFTDSSLAVNEGLFQTFYINGKKETERNYENNELNGAWEKWDSTSHLIDSITYDHGKMTDSASFYYFKNGAISSSSITNFKNDHFQRVYYTDSGRITSEVFFTGQKGIMKIYNGSQVKADSLFTREEKEASFPGGARAWQTYISKQIKAHANELSDKDYGTCIVRFIIDTDGKVSDVQATTMQGSTLAYIAVAAVKRGPKWIPAMQYGRIVKAYRLQPVTLSDPR